MVKSEVEAQFIKQVNFPVPHWKLVGSCRCLDMFSLGHPMMGPKTPSGTSLCLASCKTSKSPLTGHWWGLSPHQALYQDCY